MSRHIFIPSGARHEYVGTFAVIPSWSSYCYDSVPDGGFPVRHKSNPLRFRVVVTSPDYLGLTIHQVRDTVEECVEDIRTTVNKYSEAFFFNWASEFVAAKGHVTPYRHLEHVRNMLTMGEVYAEKDIEGVINSLPARGHKPKKLGVKKFKPARKEPLKAVQEDIW